MAKNNSRDSTSRRRKTTKARDLPAGPKARTVKGGAFQGGILPAGSRYTITNPPTTTRNTI